MNDEMIEFEKDSTNVYADLGIPPRTAGYWQRDESRRMPASLSASVTVSGKSAPTPTSNARLFVIESIKLSLMIQ